MENVTSDVIRAEPDINSTWEGNIENCSSPLEGIEFVKDPTVLGSLVPLGIICLVIIVGNVMVMAAVGMTNKLRGATYLFIVSLALADLMLGLVVLPFSAMYTVFSVWIFGKVSKALFHSHDSRFRQLVRFIRSLPKI